MGVAMRYDAAESVHRPVPSRGNEGDSERILDLIEQLDRDLIETNKNASSRE